MCLVDSLVENQGLELLVKNLERLDEADEEEEWTPDNADFNDPGSRHHY